MDFLSPELDEYINRFTENEPDVLRELNRETQAKILNPRMLAGHLQGRVISMLSHMIQPNVVLEIGTYTGYSAICWSEGLVDGGKIITMDINEELENFTRSYFAKAGIDEVVDYRIGNAIDIIPGITEKLDVVYIDADKENYGNYFDLTFPKVRSGGYIIADNVLWSGKVLKDTAQMDLDTKALLDYSKKVQEDDRVQNVLFPIRDGLMVARKK